MDMRATSITTAMVLTLDTVITTMSLQWMPGR